MVKFLYVTGITVGFLLQIAPIFLHFDRKIAEVKCLSEKVTQVFIYLFRASITAIACVIGFYSGNFATFLNLQGALLGTLISYILPAMFFLRMLSDAREKRIRDY